MRGLYLAVRPRRRWYYVAMNRAGEGAALDNVTILFGRHLKAHAIVTVSIGKAPSPEKGWHPR